jgi:hypothetical protein
LLVGRKLDVTAEIENPETRRRTAVIQKTCKQSMSQGGSKMKRCWSKVTDEWVYELEGDDIMVDKDDSPEEADLVLTISTSDEETTLKVPVERN